VKISIILPTYNEAGNIVRLIAAIQEHIPSSWEHETLVVDDNSPDGTFELVKNAYAGRSEVIPILRTSDRGLAKAIRAGIERASGDYLLVMDTDFTHDPAEFPRMLAVAEHFDIVSGSRFCPGGRMTSRRHHIASCIYNWVIRLLILTQVQDNLGGYWVAKKRDIARLPHDEIFYGYGDYFFRLLKLAQIEGMSILECPAHYRTRKTGTSKSNFCALLFQYTMAAWRFQRLLSRTGKMFPRVTNDEAKAPTVRT